MTDGKLQNHHPVNNDWRNLTKLRRKQACPCPLHLHCCCMFIKLNLVFHYDRLLPFGQIHALVMFGMVTGGNGGGMNARTVTGGSRFRHLVVLCGTVARLVCS